MLALVVRRGVASATRGDLEAWVPALVVAAGSTLLTLLRPGITPDHPWADRRLLIALPLVVVLVVVGLDRVVRRTAAAGRGWVGVTVAGVVAALVVGSGRGRDVATPRPAEWSGGRSPPSNGSAPHYARATSSWPSTPAPPTSGRRSSRGSAGCRRCRRRPPCGGIHARLAATVDTAAAHVADRGGRLVLLAADSAQSLDGLGTAAGPVVDVGVREDEHVLERRPVGTDPLPIRVWLAPARTPAS